MSDAAFESFMDRPIAKEHEYAVYLQDTCIGSVFAINDEHAMTLARAKYHFTEKDTVWIQRLK